MTEQEFYNIIYGLTPLFEKRFPDKKAADYIYGYGQAMSYLDAGEILLGFSALIESIKHVQLSAQEKQQLVDAAAYMAKIVPDNKDILQALENAQNLQPV